MQKKQLKATKKEIYAALALVGFLYKQGQVSQQQYEIIVRKYRNVEA